MEVVSFKMLTGMVIFRASNAALLLHCLTMKPSKITLPFKEPSNVNISCTKYQSDWILFAIWPRSMFSGIFAAWMAG